MHKPTVKQALIAAAGTVLASVFTLGGKAAFDTYASYDDRLEELESDRSKWELLAEHETLLRDHEVAIRVNEMLLQLLLDGHEVVEEMHPENDVEATEASVPQVLHPQIQQVDPEALKRRYEQRAQGKK